MALATAAPETLCTLLIRCSNTDALVSRIWYSEMRCWSCSFERRKPRSRRWAANRVPDRRRGQRDARVCACLSVASSLLRV